MKNTSNKPILVVGGGAAGLSAALTLLERGASVALISLVPCFQSASLLAQGGLNAALHPEDSPQHHFRDTVVEGHFLAHQRPVWQLCHAAPEWIQRLALLGVPFARTETGEIQLRFEGGSKYPRTVFANTTTGFCLLQALEAQLARYEASRQLVRYEFWEFLSLLRNNRGEVCGIVALHTPTGRIEVFQGSAIIFATGGLGQLFWRTTNSLLSTGTAAARLVREGLKYANPEFVQFHPTAALLPGMKMFLLSESIRGEGGRIWTWRRGKKWYFLEEMYPHYGNLAPRDLAARAIFEVIYEHKLGVEGDEAVYLDVTHLPREVRERHLGYVLQKYFRLSGRDPSKVPMKVSPALHYSMGGLWVLEDHSTSEEGVFAAGEMEFLYHGANRLGGNSLMACLFGGERAALSALEYSQGHSVSIQPRECELAKKQALHRIWGSSSSGEIPTPPAQLRQKMQQIMWELVGLKRHEKGLEEAQKALAELQEMASRKGRDFWQSLELRRLEDQLLLAQLITEGARRRRETRGAHCRLDYPRRRDELYLAISVAQWQGQSWSWSWEVPEMSYLCPHHSSHVSTIQS